MKWPTNGLATWSPLPGGTISGSNEDCVLDGTKATDHFNPDWQMWLDAGSAKSGVMRQDALPSTHPILQPSQIESQPTSLDGITYIKGQSFLRMLEKLPRRGKFREGMQLYMSPPSLFEHDHSGSLGGIGKGFRQTPFRALFAGWTEQPGLLWSISAPM